MEGAGSVIVYHASREVVEYPEIRKTKYPKDFSWGFYCTKDYEQAKRWANRSSRADGVPTVNYYEYRANSALSVLEFDRVCDEWLDFIANCRSGGTHCYDIVEGPMANDTVWNYVNDYLAGNITRHQFWVLAEFKYPTNQISFHTLQALDCITFLKSEVI